jgi:hypothetical protein
MTEWTELVSKVFKEKRPTNKNYKFKNALVDAKKLYRKTTNTVDSMGPGLMKKAAKSLKKAMKKTRKHRRRRGGYPPDANNKCENDSDPINDDCDESTRKVLPKKVKNDTDDIPENPTVSSSDNNSSSLTSVSDMFKQASSVASNALGVNTEETKNETTTGGRRKQQQKKNKKSKRQQKQQ